MIPKSGNRFSEKIMRKQERQNGNVRLCDHRRGSAGSVLANRLGEDLRHEDLRAGGGAERLASLHPSAGRLHQDVPHEEHQLGLPAGGRPVDRRAQHLRAARQDARRLVLDQRPHLQPRPAPGFRYLGADGQSRLGLSGRAALLQAAGAPGRRGRGHLSRPRRRAHRHHHGVAGSALRGLHGRRRQPRHSKKPRLQRRDPGRRVLLPAHHRGRPAHERGKGLPASGEEARQCRRAHPCPCHQHHLRGQARRRRALSQGRARRHAGRGARIEGSHPLRRQL